jgi:hypothetical protein
VAATVETLEARLDELARELSSAVSRAEEEAQRSRFLGQIAATIDLDDAIGSTLQAAAGLPKVDAAVVELDPDGDGDERLIGSIGLDREEGEEDSVRIFTGAPERQDPRAIELSYLYGEEHAAGAVTRHSVCRSSGRIGRIGWLGVFSPRSRRPVRRRRRAAARGARRARRARDRERAPLPRGAAARRPRLPDRASTTAATSTRRSAARSTGPSGISGALARDRGRRRLQGDQ